MWQIQPPQIIVVFLAIAWWASPLPFLLVRMFLTFCSSHLYCLDSSLLLWSNITFESNYLCTCGIIIGGTEACPWNFLCKCDLFWHVILGFPCGLPFFIFLFRLYYVSETITWLWDWSSSFSLKDWCNWWDVDRTCKNLLPCRSLKERTWPCRDFQVDECFTFDW